MCGKNTGSMKTLTGILALFLFALLPLYAADLSDLTYTTTDGEFTITDCREAARGELIIPDTIAGNPVTSIGRQAFSKYAGLTSITIPDGVTWIGNEAFLDCKSLTAVTFLGDAPEVGKGVFAGAPPTIYRKAEAKGWGDNIGGRPVKMISEKP